MFEDEINRAFPLSSSQRNIWNLERAFSGTSINNISTTIRIQGRVDFSLLQKSIHLVLASDATMRTQLKMLEGVPVQYQVPPSEETFAIYDFSHTNEEGFHSWETAMTREPISLLESPLYRFSLFRLGENVGGVLVKLHHIISDGWSQMLICNRIGQTYLQLLSGHTPQLEQSPSYRLHMEEEAEYLASNAYQKDSLYWQSLLKRAGEPSMLKSVQSAAVSPVGRRKSYRLPQVVNHAIYSFCMQNRVAPFAVYYMALAVYVKRIGGADRFTIGVPIVNRTSYQFKQSTGMFVNTLPFFNEISDEWNLTQFNESLMEAWYELLRHQRFPFEHIAQLAQSEFQREGRLFHIALSYQDSKIVENKNASVHLSGRWHYSGYQSEQLCIHLSNLEDQRHYSVDYDYLAQIFSEKEIDQLHTSLLNILLEMLGNPQKPIKRLSVISTEERERVLYTFNRTACPIREKSLYDAFCHQVKAHPHRVAVIWDGQRLTYQSLLELAGRYAAPIQKAVSARNALVAVLLPRGFALYAAIVGVMRAGYAYLLLSPELPPRRVRELLAQSGAQLLLTTQGLQHTIELSNLSIPILDVEQLPCTEKTVPAQKAAPEELAYVVYTSGSTGAPKGVEITQQNLLNLVQAMRPIYGKGAVLSLCNIGFDAFVLESAAALLNGRTIILPREEELESPRRLAALITGYGVGFFAMTPSRLSAFLKEPAFYSAMRSMESIVCGGEAFPSGLLKQLKNAGHARIYNQYGPSETTVGVTLKELSQAAAITVGAPMPNCKLYVLDRWHNPLPVGVYGQLYVGGLCVGRGYRNAPEQTEKSFIKNPFELGERMYSTGDVACWTAEGELMLAGRLDRQVKLRGVRIEPQEVAACIASHPQVREAVARVCEQNGQQLLIVYYCAQAPVPEVELLTFAASYLPRYMLPSAILWMESIPLTDNGKVDEAKLPLPCAPVQEVGGPEDDLTRRIVAIFRQVLKQPDLRADSDYFICGGNSLNAMEVIGAVEDAIGRAMRVSDLYACRTARRLAQLLQGGQDTQAAPAKGLRPAPTMERYPLTPIQQGIYVQSFLDPEGLAYHMPGAFRLGFEPDEQRLSAAFCQLIQEERLLRTRFVQEPAGVFARVEPEAPFSLQRLRAASLEEAGRRLIAPFDLAKPPLLRAGLWRSQAGECYLLMDCHHIVGDGMSTPLLLKRLDAYYNGEKPTLPQLCYLDYAYASSQMGEQEKEPDRRYWKQHLTPPPPPLELPTDFARSHPFDYRGEGIAYTLPASLKQACETFCGKEGLTPYMLLLGAFGVLLAAVSGKGEMLVGTPVSGRTKPPLQELCGPFITMLPVKLSPQGTLSVKDYLFQIRDAVNGMLEHPHCSMEEMLSMLELPRTTSQNALYQVAFSMRPFAVSELSLGGAPLTYFPVQLHTAKSELFLEVAEEQGSYQLSFEYASSLFMEETIALYARSFEAILRSIVDDRAARVEEIACLSLRDQTNFWDIPNYAYTPFLNLPIHRLAAMRAARAPEEAAVLYHGQTLSRRELERQAQQVAARLAEAGVRPGDKVAFALRRTPRLFAAMLAILKAGAAYVPLVATLPQERIRYMLETAGASFLLCDQQTKESLPADLPARLVLADGPLEGRTWMEPPVTGAELCYVLFTSGSTGRPKGVMVEHRAVSNLYSNMKALLAEVRGPILCTASPVFDIFLIESLFPLAMGNPVVLADEEEMLLPWRLARLIRETGTRCLQLTASRLQLCLSNEVFCDAAAALQLVMVGGESLSHTLAERFRQVCKGRLINMYGPTETTVSVTMAEVLPDSVINIGRPMGNCRVYVLNERQRPALPTACGELYIGGECVAMGYASHPDLTEQAFLPDPFFPGSHMYRTGDLGRLRVDGSIDFLGRRDSQVKINGQRVELEEIISLMQDSGLAVQAAVLPRGKPDGSVELCAFYTSAQGQTDVSEQMEDYLRQYLPSYMVPAHFYPLSEMPYTPSGKIDLQRLKSGVADIAAALPAKRPLETGERPEENRQNGLALSTVPTVGEPEACSKAEAVQEKSGEKPRAEKAVVSPQRLLKIWSGVLGEKELREDVSFFQQGGTSLGALSVLSQYFNDNLVLTMAQFYEHPTARAQAALLSSTLSAGQAEEKEEEAAIDRAEFPRSVPQNVNVERQDERKVLLTGATGYFGAHLLQALLESGVQRVICLVRRGDRERLLRTLAWYFGSGWTASEAGRLAVVSGDLSQPRLGLTQEAFAQLAGSVDAVYHCAADVRHYAAEEAAYLAGNVEGTQTVAELALMGGIPLYHMSTASISGEFLTDDPRQEVGFSEHDFYIGQNWQDNIYIKSKFLAEARVYEAVRSGLRAKVFRLGRIVGRATDGVFQKDPATNAAFLLLRAIANLGAIPRSMARLPVDLTPVDWCARAVLALRDAEGTAFHLMHPHPPDLWQVVQSVLPGIELCADDAFDQLLAERLKQQELEVLAPLLDYRNQRQERRTFIRCTCEETVRQLAKCNFTQEIPEPGRLLRGIAGLLSAYEKGERQ